MNVAFIGLGIMGRPMAGHLIDAGHALSLYDIAETPAELVAKGATACKSAAEATRRSDVIILMVPDTPHVRAALFEAGGVAEALSPGKIVVDMSSISPIETKRFAAEINKLDCDYLDAPVSGGEVGAKAASLTIMVGGPQRAFERVRPLFEAMGKNITLVGGNGDGQTTKVANQIIVALTIQAVAEALLFASKAGADPAKVRQALMGGFASSRILEVHGERMIKRNFHPGFRIELHQKDLNLALASARALQISLLPGAVQCLRGARGRRLGPFRPRPHPRNHGRSPGGVSGARGGSPRGRRGWKPAPGPFDRDLLRPTEGFVAPSGRLATTVTVIRGGHRIGASRRPTRGSASFRSYGSNLYRHRPRKRAIQYSMQAL
jgi:2-hydroxy-3-oxopropionate reductase